ncbi:MAG: hydroxypyruvate isomerase family protein [Betaproteobacteria bacterium]|nr:hydroxypyruvate isomerase family protein [Betaproteobacteria bacterium]
MPQFAANLSLMYTEYAFLDRFAAAAQDGFAGVEFLFPYEHVGAELRTRLTDNGLQQVLFNAPPGGATRGDAASAWARGERGTACLPGREAEFRFGIALALEYAAALGCPHVHVMAGLVPAGAEPQRLQATFLSNLQHAAAEAAKVGVDILIEPINTRDMPGYFLNRQDHAHALVQAVGASNLRVQMDLYHCQIVEGDLATKLRQYLPSGRVGHIQIAGVPQRHEPDTGELNYPYLFGVIDELGYPGWVGCEYRPCGGERPGATREGLGWMPRK